MSAEGRLADLGLTLPEPPAAVAAFVPVTAIGDVLYISGQIATHDGELVHRGRVGAEVTLADAALCARQCALNLLAQLRQHLGSLERVELIVKLQVYVVSAPTFAEQHLVANGASELLLAVFGPEASHARSAIGVAALPFSSPVELDAVVSVKST